MRRKNPLITVLAVSAVILLLVTAPSDASKVTHNGPTTATNAGYDDLRVDSLAVKLQGSADPVLTAWGSLFLYGFHPDNLKEVFITMQMPHGWDNTGLTPHVHWTPVTTSDETPANQSVEWCIDYVFKELSAVYAPASPATLCASSYVPATTITADTHYLTGLGTITPDTTNDGLSGVLVGRIYRKANDALDTYEGTALLLSVDLHYRRTRHGSTYPTSN